jgi:hypothetical protein
MLAFTVFVLWMLMLTIILWPCILIGARFEFQYIINNPDPYFCILQSPLVSANDTTSKQDMTASF